ncbi:MAG: hypothetical protein FD174_3914 [Geobacteraceae bacterium]|nr:MAG: hypothetical protein FD174_3914 [Geobacteraceae bacterium]
MKALINTLIASIVTASSAFAASGALEDNSGIFVWAFLGMCALIVIGQLLPTVLLMLGFAKGVAKEKKAEAA